MNEKLKCPICSRRHDWPPDTVFDASYCPHCGVPNFFSPGRVLPRVRCVLCNSSFEPRRGGGTVVVFHMNPDIEERTPQGLLESQVLAK